MSSSPDLCLSGTRMAFSACANDRLSPNAGTSAHTVAVPFVICTRFSILPRGCYRLRGHSNGYSVAHRIALKASFVNDEQALLQEAKILPEWMVEIPHDLPFRQHFLNSVLPSIGLAFRGCGNGESKISVPLVEGLRSIVFLCFAYSVLKFLLKVAHKRTTLPLFLPYIEDLFIL